MADTVVVPPADGKPAADAHAAAMQKKVDEAGKAIEAGKQPEGSKPQRPDGVPEKFWDAEKGTVKTDDLLKSYSELEKKQGSAKPDEKQDDGAKKAAEDEVAKKAAEAAAAAKLDLVPFEKEYAEKGALTDESYKALEAKGVTREMVDNYIAGRIATAEKYERDVFAAASISGREQYESMVEWAKANLKPDELETYNKQVVATAAEAKLAVAGLKARYDAAVGSDPNLVQGKGKGPSADIFRSVEEHKAAIRDPRYKKDSAYRAEVESKLARSDIY